MKEYCKKKSLRGQSTVEAAFLVPVVFICLLILIQPAILLVNRIVMEAAAYEGCRFALTCVQQSEQNSDVVSFIERRLRIFPPTSVVHCPPWDIEVGQDYETHEVTVRISHYVKPLPLVGSEILLWGNAQLNGLYFQEVEVSKKLRGDWLLGTVDDPSLWIERWEDAV